VSAATLPSAEHYRITSLLYETDAPVDLDDLLERVLTGLRVRVEQVRENGLSGLLPEWRVRSLELGRFVTVERAGETIQGAVRDIGPDGSLQVETDRGVLEIAPHGEVSVIVGARAGLDGNCT